MWAKVAEEMQVPWRAAEAMHWQLGESDMARRAGVIPFSLNMSGGGDTQVSQRLSPTRGHQHSQSQGSIPREISGVPSPRYGRGPSTPLVPSLSSGRPLAARRESVPPQPPYRHQPDASELGYGISGPGFGLAPIQTTNVGQGRGGLLPSVAELTTGVSPYSTPAYSVGVPSASPVHSATASPGPLLPSMSTSYPPLESAGGKRRASPETGARETSRRRHLHPLQDEIDPSSLGPMRHGHGHRHET